MPTWVRGYERTWLRGDVLAGVTVTAYLIPQVMAYAEVAGVPPEAALWAAVGGLTVYVVLGSSRQLSVGPGVDDRADDGDGARVRWSRPVTDRVALAAALALMVGVCCLIGWVLRLGALADLLSRPGAGRATWPASRSSWSPRSWASCWASPRTRRRSSTRYARSSPPRPGPPADGDARPRHARRAADAQPLLPAGAGRADRHARRDGGRVLLRPPGPRDRRRRRHPGRPARPRPSRRRSRRPDLADRSGGGRCLRRPTPTTSSPAARSRPARARRSTPTASCSPSAGPTSAPASCSGIPVSSSGSRTAIGDAVGQRTQLGGLVTVVVHGPGAARAQPAAGGVPGRRPGRRSSCTPRPAWSTSASFRFGRFRAPRAGAGPGHHRRGAGPRRPLRHRGRHRAVGARPAAPGRPPARRRARHRARRGRACTTSTTTRRRRPSRA